jgi:Tol biopolymer transport system component
MTKMLLGGLVATLLLYPKPNLAAQAIHPQWSADGEWLTWYQRIDNRSQVHRARPDGTDHRVLLDDGGWYANPSFVPNSNRMALSVAPAGMMGTWNLLTIDMVTGERCQLTNTTAREMHASASPDGVHIAFVRMADGTSDLWLTDQDGNERALTQSPGREFHPKWSPDGSRIVFDYTEGDVQSLQMLDVASGRVSSVAGLAGRASMPAWLADSRSLVFTAPDGANRTNLFRIGIDGLGRTRLTDLAGMTGAPFVSPDGTRIAFHATHEGDYHIYVLDIERGAIWRVSP